MKEFGWTWPSIQDPERDSPKQLGADYQPYVAVIDADGNIVATFDGGGDEATWEALVERLPTDACGTARTRTTSSTLREVADPRAVVVVLHGGFWRARYGADLMDELCDDLAARGYAAWNVEYRRVGAGGGWPATFDDVEAATRRANDGLPLVTLGHSAGGHLAVWAARAAARRSPSPRRACSTSRTPGGAGSARAPRASCSAARRTRCPTATRPARRRRSFRSASASSWCTDAATIRSPSR